MPGVLLSAPPLPSQIQRIACKDPADCETVASLPKQTPGSQNSPGAHTSLSSGGIAADSREDLTTSSSFVSDPTIRNPGPGPHDNSHCAVGSTSAADSASCPRPKHRPAPQSSDRIPKSLRTAGSAALKPIGTI